MNLARRSFIKLSEKNSLLIIFFSAPLLNFFVGLILEMFAPSVPFIIDYFHLNYLQGHRTLNAFMLGLGFGCLFVGVLMDLKGKRVVILGSFIILAFLGALSHHVEKIWVLQFMRIGQGVATAAFSLGARAFIFDNFTGLKYKSGITYIAFAYGLGVIFAPVISSQIIDLYGWKSIFVAYAILSMVLFLFFFLFVDEGKEKATQMSFSEIMKEYLKVGSDKHFFVASLILGCIVFQLLYFSLLMPHFFLTKLNVSIKAFGFYAMTVGIVYLFGTLVNRGLISRFSTSQICSGAYGLMGFSLLLYLVFSMFLKLSVWSILIPSFGMVFSVGLLFPNIIAETLKLHPTHIGITVATQMMLYLTCCSALIGFANVFHFSTRLEFALFLSALFIIQFILYQKVIKHSFERI